MNKVILTTIAAMFISGSAIAGESITPPVTKYVENVPYPPKRPDNFGKIDHKKVDQQIQETTTRK